MAIRQPTLRLVRDLRVTVGVEADQATRDLTAAWVRAWNTLAPDLRAALLEVAAQAAEHGHWPKPWELARIQRLRMALLATQEALAKLGDRTGVTVSDAAGLAIQATAEVEPRLIASQLPAAGQATATATFAARLTPSALDAIVARTQSRIVAVSRPLSGQAMDVMRRELIRGVAGGSNPRESARQMLARTEGAFNGGLSRAVNIARTEVLDAYRTTSREIHAANADVVGGWVWTCALQKNSCAACWSKHGTVYPVTTPGPWDHQSGRCSRVPKARPWRELGIDLDEPDDLIPDARTRFDGLPKADQVAILGPARLELLRSGHIDWADLAVRRDNPDWRPSYAPRTVADLQRRARATI